MPKASKAPAFYAVAKGHHPGIYESWDECERQVKGFQGAKHKKFMNVPEAESWIKTCSPGVVIDTSNLAASTSAAPNPPSRQRSARLARSSKGKERSASLTPEQSRPGWRIVYCDGACKGNGKTGSVAGVGVYWGPNDPRNLAERCPGSQTNNRAELIAITRILETTPKDKTPLEIRTDSRYSINCVKEWLPNWKKRGFKTAGGDPVKNAPLIRYMDALLNERGRLGQKVVFKHVYGHMGEEGNENADRLANQGCWLAETPERDWAALEQEVLDSAYWDDDAEAVQPIVIDDDPEPPVQDATESAAPIEEMEWEPTPPAPPPEPTPATPKRSPFRPAKVPPMPVTSPTPAPRLNAVHENPASSLTASAPIISPIRKDTAVQTLPWVHPDGLVPPNPCLPSVTYQGNANAIPRVPASTIPSEKLAPAQAIPVDELNAYADCLLDDDDLKAELSD